MTIQSLLASNLKQQRKMANLTQAELAKRCGLQRTYIGGIEQGRVNVSIKNVGKIADALGVSPACLLMGEGEEVRSAGPAAVGPAAAKPASGELVLANGECVLCACDGAGHLVVRAISADCQAIR